MKTSTPGALAGAGENGDLDRVNRKLADTGGRRCCGVCEIHARASSRVSVCGWSSGGIVVAMSDNKLASITPIRACGAKGPMSGAGEKAFKAAPRATG